MNTSGQPLPLLFSDSKGLYQWILDKTGKYHKDYKVIYE